MLLNIRRLNAVNVASNTLLLAGCVWGLGLLLSNSEVAAAPIWQDDNRPNIIVIYTDDQGFGDTSHLNPDAKFETPNMDRLAKEGISFTNGHSADAVCSPSRYALLTGRYCWRTELKRSVLLAEHKCLITDDRVTLPSFLRDNGYDTAMVGKWHLGMDFPGKDAKTRDWTKPVLDMPLDKGFDYFFGVPASLNFGVLAWFDGRFAAVPPTVFTAKKPNKRHDDYRIMPPYQDTPEETREVLKKGALEVAADFIDNQCLTRFTDKAIDWMKTKTEQTDNDKPFFLYLPFTSPHYPVCPLPEFWGQGQCGGYGEFVIETDHHIGRILEFLEKSGLDESTMIVFSSDNGPETSWKKRIKQFDHDSSYIYRGGKREVYEGGHRVPMFVRWPAGIKNPGRDWSKVVGQIDLLATVAELLGKPLPEGCAEDSQSFAKVLTDPTFDYDRLPLINHSITGRFSVTQGNWKLVFPGKALTKMAKNLELYDLGSDPAESKNLAADYPDRVEALTKLAADIVVNGRTTAGPVRKNDTGYWKDLNWIAEEQYNSRQKATEMVPSK
ncbi:arylsulfatase [Mariniblastus sp.]|nr:arylsulfatase [Mariniblastus sp.]